MNTDVQALVEALRDAVPRVPLNQALWSADDVADYLRVSRRTVTERYACRPDFPEPIRLPSDGKRGHLRWRARDVIKWVG